MATHSSILPWRISQQTCLDSAEFGGRNKLEAFLEVARMWVRVSEGREVIDEA